LTLQNRDGGFASYELVRGPEWLEWLNPAEVFGEFVPVHRYGYVTYPSREDHDRIRVSGMHHFGDHLACYLPKALPRLQSGRHRVRHPTSPSNMLAQQNLFYQQNDHTALHNVFTCCPTARGWLGGLLGYLLYLCDDVRSGESFPCRRNVRDKRVGAAGVRLPRKQAKGRWWLGRELQGMPHTPELPSNSAQILWAGMRGLRVGRTRRYPGRSNSLGGDGTHVRKVP